jgi:NitT/TauT family transport system permease protein
MKNLNRLWIQLDRLWVPVMLIAVWEWFSRSGFIPPALLPAPSRVMLSLADWMFSIDEYTQDSAGHWIIDAMASCSRVFAGYLIAAVLGVGLGIGIGWSKVFERRIEPTLQMLRPVPPVSWIPLAIIWFGIANKPAIFLVFLGAFFPILINTIHGVKIVNRDLLRAAAMAGAHERQLLRFVVIPAAMPNVFAGLRIGVGSAWMLTVTAEMVAVKSGLGYVLWDSYYFLRYDMVIASMISIGLLGFLTDLGVKSLMNRLLHWQRSGTVQGNPS